MTEQTEPSGIHKKLLAVMRDVERIHKTGHNNHFNYDYATEQDIKEAVGAGFRKHGLTMRIDEIGVPMLGPEQTTKEGRTLRSWLYPIKFVVVDVDTDQEIRSTFLGQGDDSDKSEWKAITGAIKYYLTSLLLIPTGDDPERDGGAGNNNQSAERSRSSGGAPGTSPVPGRDAAKLPPSVVCSFKGCGMTFEGDDVKGIKVYKQAKYSGRHHREGDSIFRCPACNEWTPVREPAPVPTEDPGDGLPF